MMMKRVPITTNLPQLKFDFTGGEVRRNSDRQCECVRPPSRYFDLRAKVRLGDVNKVRFTTIRHRNSTRPNRVMRVLDTHGEKGEQMSFGKVLPGALGGIGDGVTGGIVGQLICELINPAFNEGTRRRLSIVRAPYRQILDPFVGQPYPLNCIGTYARLIPTNLESFVNMGSVIKIMMAQNIDGELGELLKKAAQDDEALSNVRLALRHAVHEIGSRSYAYEWRDDITFGNIDSLLEELANYSEHNAAVVEQVKPAIMERLSKGEFTVVLDAGSGVGGTSAELLAIIPEEYHKNLKIVMYDVSNDQMKTAKELLERKYSFKNVDTVRGNFRDIGSILKRYRGEVDVVISGAAFCHVILKNRFFKNIGRLMRKGGVISFWDPAISYFLAHRIRESSNKESRIIYCTDKAEPYVVERGKYLPIQAVRESAGKDYTTIAEVPGDELVILSTALAHMYLGQMGYSEQNVGEKNLSILRAKLQSDLLNGSRSQEGFDLIQWYRDNLINDERIPRIPEEQWTPYDLIEAVSDQEEYRKALTTTDFKNYRARRPHKPIPFDTREEALKSVLTYFYAEKA